MKSNLQDEITPEKLYFSRRKFLKIAGALGITAALAACGVSTDGQNSTTTPASLLEDALTPYETVTSYNNFYEFALDKESVAAKSANMNTSDWKIEIGGLVEKPVTISTSELLQNYPQEERIYRLRCVEGWSMVIPWLGFPLNKLLADVGVKENARFIQFTPPYNTDIFPNQKDILFPWPYVEGLRLDEALHDLTLLAGGLYGKSLPPQDGAPIRLVVPWKYGFKSVKSIQKIELVAEQPVNFWQATNPAEYGFYANVNPDVPHPRWSQSSERRLGELSRRSTLPFNGYSEEVAAFYAGMDLTRNF
jgi:methionine sulfoxide reductase catalytic subunit